MINDVFKSFLILVFIFVIVVARLKAIELIVFYTLIFKNNLYKYSVYYFF